MKMYEFSQKLKLLKGVLCHWNRTFFGNVFQNVLQAEQEVKQRELQYDVSQQSVDLEVLNLTQAKLLKFLAEEEVFLRQKSRVTWLKEGDSNSKFLHASILEKRSKSCICRIKNFQGVWLEDQTQIVQHAMEFYKDLHLNDSGSVAFFCNG